MKALVVGIVVSGAVVITLLLISAVLQWHEINAHASTICG